MVKRLLPLCVALALVVCLGQGSSAQPPSTFFPLGLMGPSVDYDPPSLGTEAHKVADVAAGGFNVVFEFRSIQETSEAEDYLNQAEALGLQVIQNMPSCRAYENDLPECLAHPEIDVWTQAEWADFISTLSTHDNLVAWFLPDGIDNLEVAADLYQWVKEYDPQQRPVYGQPDTFDQSVVNQFPAFTDFLWICAYPEYYGESRSIVTYAMRMDAEASRGTDNEWGAILQYFDNSEFGRDADHPTARELRADSYQAIIGGAKGLWYFSYEMGRILGDGLWEAMETVADEIIGTGGLDEVILSPDVPQGIMKHIVSGPTKSPAVRGEVYNSIQSLQKWQEGEGTYLFVVNIATDTVVVEFSNLWAETDQVEVLFEGRTIPIVNDRFTDTFAQDDVHIYFYEASKSSLPLIYLPIVLKNSS